MNKLFFIVLLSVFAFSAIECVTSSNFGYGHGDGVAPALWYTLTDAATCGIENSDESQSPIHITTCSARRDDSIDDLDIDWVESVEHVSVFHTRTVLEVEIPEESQDELRLSNGPLGEEYHLIQFHLHWGRGDGGSEHMIDGKRYAAECHFVHTNDDNSALAVVGVMLDLVDDDNNINTELDRIIQASRNLVDANSPHIELDDLEINELLPNSLDFFTYSGSLTTPPCSEIVTWINLRHPIEITRSQLDILQEITYDDSTTNFVAPNFRPVQPLNGRTVKRSFSSDDDGGFSSSATTLYLDLALLFVIALFML